MPWLLMRARRDRLADRLTIPRTTEQRATLKATAAGFQALPDYLQHLVETQRWTRSRVQAHTGLQGRRVAQLLTEAGSPAPEDLRERWTLEAAGWTGTLVEYVTARDRAGWTLQRMSFELGRSDVWLAKRLRRHGGDHLIHPPGHRRNRPAPG